jgi:hypothetical protein
MPTLVPHETVYDSSGEPGKRIVESVRGADSSTPGDEVDDASDWFE